MAFRRFSYTATPESPRDGEEFIKYVIAIDFGTSRSGIAFGIFDDKDARTTGKLVHVDLATLPASSSAAAASSATGDKEPTYLVMETGAPDAIGFSAFQAALDKERPGHFVTDFKMMLDVKRRAKEGQSLQLKSTTVPTRPICPGKSLPGSMPLLDVVSRFLAVAGNIGFEALKKRAESSGRPTPKREEVIWVVTVPAIWTDQARIFMREAMCRAKLVPSGGAGEGESKFTKNIRVCLEPEGAALASFANWKGDKKELLNKKLMIIDLGGGTADITLHTIAAYARLLDLITFEEIIPPSGGDWGGRMVNRAFEEHVLKPFLGPDAWADYQSNFATSACFIQDHFEPAKAPFDGSSSLIVPVGELFESLSISGDSVSGAAAVNQNLPPDQHVVFNAGRRKTLTLPAPLVRSLFAKVLDPICAHLQELIGRHSMPDLVFLVGGMGRNPHVGSVLRDFFTRTGKTQFLVDPTTSSMAIVIGATRFGYDENSFALRKARTNYGIALYNKDDVSRDIFGLLITKGEDLKAVERKTRETPFGPYAPVTETQKSISIEIHECETVVAHTTDFPCVPVAKLTWPLDMSLPMADRSCKITISMSSTVITGTVIDTNTGAEQKIQWSSR